MMGYLGKDWLSSQKFFAITRVLIKLKVVSVRHGRVMRRATEIKGFRVVSINGSAN